MRQDNRVEIENEIDDGAEREALHNEVRRIIHSINTKYARVTIEPVTEEKHQANKSLAEAVSETDTCLECGKEIEEGGFCGYECVTKFDVDEIND